MSNVTTALACLVLLAFPENAVPAAPQSAIANISRVATLNGVAVTSTTTIFVGDVLETNASSSLVINSNRSTVSLGTNSRVRYLGNSIELQSGFSQVATSKQLGLQAGVINVTPTGTSAKFQVNRAPHKVVISAL